MAILRMLSRHATRVSFGTQHAIRFLSSPVLRLEPNDPDASLAKLALLLHTDQHSRALGLSETLLGGVEQTTFSLVFGNAYALYRLNREPQAHHVVQNIKPKGENEERAVMHLKAQIVCHTRSLYQILNHCVLPKRSIVVATTNKLKTSTLKYLTHPPL